MSRQGQLCGSPAKNSPKQTKGKGTGDDLWLAGCLLIRFDLRSAICNLRNVILIWSCLALKGSVANIQIATRRRRAPIAVNLLSIVIPCMWVAPRGYTYARWVENIFVPLLSFCLGCPSQSLYHSTALSCFMAVKLVFYEYLPHYTNLPHCRVFYRLTKLNS